MKNSTSCSCSQMKGFVLAVNLPQSWREEKQNKEITWLLSPVSLLGFSCWHIFFMAVFPVDRWTVRAKSWVRQSCYDFVTLTLTAMDGSALVQPEQEQVLGFHPKDYRANLGLDSELKVSSTSFFIFALHRKFSHGSFQVVLSARSWE